jgi:hypothetical protein
MILDNHTLFDAQAIPLPGPGGYQLTVILKGTFAFDGSPCVEQSPIAFGDLRYNEDQGDEVRCESDIVPFKPVTDVILCGRAQAPGGRSVDALEVSLTVGPVCKTLKIFGQRLWNHAGVFSRRYTATAPKPFVSLPLRYTEAFGGIDAATGECCPYNLNGKGFRSKGTKANLAGVPLPRIEDPRHLIQSPRDHPRPAGFGFYHRAWQPRVAYAGTHDAAWRKRRSPLPPADFDARFYNGAYPDLQAKTYLRGNEPVELINLTPEGIANFQLPGVTPCCGILRAETRKTEAPAMNLDTVFIEPDQGTLCLVWRGATPLAGLSDAEIARVTLTAEATA